VDAGLEVEISYRECGKQVMGARCAVSETARKAKRASVMGCLKNDESLTMLPTGWSHKAQGKADGINISARFLDICW
jgi:hypothetical protein